MRLLSATLSGMLQVLDTAGARRPYDLGSLPRREAACTGCKARQSPTRSPLRHLSWLKEVTAPAQRTNRRPPVPGVPRPGEPAWLDPGEADTPSRSEPSSAPEHFAPFRPDLPEHTSP